MKKQILLLILFPFSFMAFLQAGDFAPVGATWYYSEGFFDGPPNAKSDYIKFESVKDTLINGKTCRKITKRHRIICNFRPDVEYLMTRNDTVFIYEEWLKDFVILYDFNAEKSDKWLVPIKSWYDGEVDTLTLVVDSTDYVTYNGHELKRMFVDYYHEDDQSIVYSAEIIERIGDVNYLFNPLFNWDIPCDGNYSQGLRCYQDEVIGLYETGIAESCDEIIPWHTSGLYDAKCESMNPHEIDTTYFWYRSDTLFIRNINNEFCTSDGRVAFYTVQFNTYDIGILDYGLNCLADCSFGYTLKIPTEPFDTIQVILNWESFQVVYKDIVNSVSNLSENQPKIFPNPVKDILNIDIEDIRAVKIFAVSGQMLQSHIGVEKEISVTNLKKGTYIVQVVTGRGSYTQKIVKQ